MPFPPIPASACLAELRRVAALLRRDTLTTAEFDRHGAMSSRTVVARWKTWGAALHRAGLTWRANQWHETPLAALARALVQATVDLGHIPTCTELSRLAECDRKTLSDRWGGYVAFKRAALAHLLAAETRLAVAPDVRAMLEEEAQRVNRGAPGWPRRMRTAGGSRQGTPLGIRGFVYAPTCEQGVVQLFGAVAQDLGFEILHTQTAFPDSLVRRTRTKKRLRVEFEFTSRDFKRHAHAPAGCDLIICWHHDWPESPLPVLDLSRAIRQLPAETRTPSTRGRRRKRQ